LSLAFKLCSLRIAPIACAGIIFHFTTSISVQQTLHGPKLVAVIFISIIRIHVNMYMFDISSVVAVETRVLRHFRATHKSLNSEEYF